MVHCFSDMERKRRFCASEALKQILEEESDSSVDDWGGDVSEGEYLPAEVVSESEDESNDLEEAMEPDEEDGPSGQNPDAAIGSDRDKTGLIGRNGMVWDEEPPVLQGRRRVQDILTQAMGVKDCGDVTSVSKSLQLFVTDNIVMIIVRYTNKFANSTYQAWNDVNPTEPKNWRETDYVESKAFIGLLLLAGVYRSNHESLEELWCEEDQYLELP